MTFAIIRQNANMRYLRQVARETTRQLRSLVNIFISRISQILHHLEPQFIAQARARLFPERARVNHLLTTNHDTQAAVQILIEQCHRAFETNHRQGYSIRGNRLPVPHRDVAIAFLRESAQQRNLLNATLYLRRLVTHNLRDHGPNERFDNYPEALIALIHHDALDRYLNRIRAGHLNNPGIERAILRAAAILIRQNNPGGGHAHHREIHLDDPHGEIEPHQAHNEHAEDPPQIEDPLAPITIRVPPQVQNNEATEDPA